MTDDWILQLTLTAAGVVASAVTLLRWLRVAQREHYLSGSVSLFVKRWWYRQPLNAVLWAVALAAVVASAILPAFLFVTAVIVAAGPIGLSLRGRTGALAWTKRMKTLAGIVISLQLIGLGLGLLLGYPATFAVGVALLTPTLVDIGLAIAAPIERRRAQVFLDQAKQRLASVAPEVVAITGSYGKTSTKNYVAHLLKAEKAVVATPASYNNLAGLSRSINEHLSPGTDVFVAEMGTYGYGEIAELCRLCPPKVAVLTAVGPVHLERFGSEAAIISAKAEIFSSAEVAVINVDDDRLARLADTLESEGTSVWRCGTTAEGIDVRVEVAKGQLRIEIPDRPPMSAAVADAPAGNIAVAVAVALAMGINAERILSALSSLPVVPHRQESRTDQRGVQIIDDTYNLNPAGAKRALVTLQETAATRKVVVTPGMVELGRIQDAANSEFAQQIASVATDLVVVGRTNRKALKAGVESAVNSEATAVNVIEVATLPRAVDWVRQNVESGDVVLYANDLPDHYP